MGNHNASLKTEGLTQAQMKRELCTCSITPLRTGYAADRSA
jgi:hypothetical protein